MDTLSTVAKFVASLGEAVASGPFFKVMLVNLLPGQILQPFVDAAFKKRGIDPEKFWRDAGLPAWRFPDPNAVRFANGAPAPAPAVLEGTPENPGPGVLKGSPCSYTPPADGLPRPGDPLPCADLTIGPFGGPAYGPPDVATSAPNAHGPQPSPGVPAAAIPGQMPPNVPGVHAPIAPGPPGGRTVPLSPAAGTAGLHARHRAAAAGLDRAAAATGTRSGACTGRATAVAGQPAVPPARAARIGQGCSRCRQSSTSETSSCRAVFRGLR